MAFNYKYLQDEIIDQYLYDENKDRPWIVGFSGGKDSTMLLQVVWYAIRKIPAELRKRDIYVICNNTLVENPKILQYVDDILKKIEKAAASQSMPVFVHKTIPRLEHTFWVNLIGKGYPAPNNMFRWCTERLKINPTSRFIIDKINDNGKVIILLGLRYDESSSRAQTINKYEIKGKRLRKHILPNAYVYAPLKDVTINELWQYLNQIDSPWGANNKNLIALYKNANNGDCPLVIDKTTPPCGNSRFGCWICTVVKRDKSMEGLIDSGEKWMEPLMKLRDYLYKGRNDHKNRMERRRDGTKKSGILGPYYPEYRFNFLKKLLLIQKQIQKKEPKVELISHQELVAIQITWYRDSIFKYKIADLYNKIFQKEIDMKKFEEKFRKEEELLKKSCKKSPNDFELIQNLLSIQKTKTLMLRKRGLQNDIENRISEFINPVK